MAGAGEPAAQGGKERRRRFGFMRREAEQQPLPLDETKVPRAPRVSSIGRTAEVELFRRLAGVDDAEPTDGVVLAIVGAAGSGKRSLLEDFARQAVTRVPARGARIVDLADPGDLPDVLEQLALDLDPDGFKRFRTTLKKFRERQARGKTRRMEIAETIPTITSGVYETLPTLPTAGLNAAGKAVPAVAGTLERPSDLESLKRDFLSSFAGFAALDRASPTVLLFCDLDRVPDHPTTTWLRKRLIVDATSAGALVVVSVETEDALHALPAEVPRLLRDLDALSEEDAFAFVEERLQISPNTSLAREIVKVSGRYPDRLARLEAYFARYEDARKLDKLPEDARVWTAGSTALEPFERLESPAVRRLALCASALRRFNEPLLRTIAAAVGIPPDSAPAAIDALVDSKLRPPWIAAGTDGWSITPQIRTPLLNECGRLDPDLLRTVHETAIRYYHDRLMRLDGQHPTPPGPADAFVAQRPPADRFSDLTFVGVLGDWLYHLAAVAPETAFQRMIEEAVDALFAEQPEAAVRVLEVGPDNAFPADCEAYRAALADVAIAIRDDRHVEAIAAIVRLEALELSDESLRIGADHFIGVAGAQVQWPAERLATRFARAEERLSSADDECRLRRRGVNLVWLAYHGWHATNREDEALARLDLAEKIGTQLGDADLRAQACRVRSFIAQEAEWMDEALAQLDSALEILSTRRAPRSTAQILLDKARLFRERTEMELARRELERAAQIARALDDPSLEADVGVEMVRVELAASDVEAAATRAAEVAEVRPFDAGLRNDIGDAYFEVGQQTGMRELLERSVIEYSAAIALVEEATFFKNRGYARLALGRLDDAPDDSNLHAGVADFEGAARRGLADARLYVEAAELRRELGDEPGDEIAATASARAALDVVVVEGPTVDGRAADGTWEVVDRALELVGTDPAVELERIAREYPGDPRPHYLLALAHRNKSPASPEAANALERALELSDDAPERVTLLVTLADVWCASGNVDRAQPLVDEALGLDPADTRVDAVRQRIAEQQQRDRYDVGADDDSIGLWSVRLELGDELVARINPDVCGDRRFLDEVIPLVRNAVGRRTGFSMGGIRCARSADLGPWAARLLIHGVPILDFDVQGAFIAAATLDECTAKGIAANEATAPWDGSPACVVAEEAKDDLVAADIPVWDALGAIAATIEPALRRNVGRLITTLDAAWTAYSQEWAVDASELVFVAELMRELAAAGVAPEEVTDAIRSGGIVAARERLAHLVATRTGPPDAEDPLAYALAFTPAPARTASVVVRIGAAIEPDDLALRIAKTLDDVCRALVLPAADTEVVQEAELPPNGFEVAIAGRVRVAGTTDGARRLSPHYCSAASKPLAPAGDVVVGAVEHALWDDPSLLFPTAEAAARAEETLEQVEIDAAAADWASAFRRVVALRVPLEVTDETGAQQTTLGDAVAAVASGLNELIAASTAEALESRPARPVPDGSRLGARDVIPFRKRGRVAGLRVGVTIRHRYGSDLTVRLIAPDGRTATLHDRDSVFGRDVRLALETPESPELAPLVGAEAEGDWTLHVQDVEKGDTGALVAWSLELDLDGSTAEERKSGQRVQSRALLDVKRTERLAYALRPYGVEVRVGHGLAAEFGADGAMPPDEARPPLDRIASRLGVPLRRTVRWTAAEDLAEREYEVRVNGSTRSRGDIPAGSIFEPVDLLESATAFDPETGRPGAWVPTGTSSSVDARSAARFVAANAARHIRDDIDELIDIGTVEQLLDTLSAFAPLLAARIRERHPVEVVTAVLRSLAQLGVSLRDQRALDSLVALDERTVRRGEFDGADGEVIDDWLRPQVLAEYVAAELADRIAYLHCGSGVSVEVIELDDETEVELRAAVGGGDELEPVYDVSAAPILRMIEGRLLAAPDDAPIVLLASPDLRRHVHRLLAAQFPGLPVLGPQHLATVRRTKSTGAAAPAEQIRV
jgi:flagellar biosynthesis component FlhA/tetratricopeptide (TPR) repeat protein